MGSCQEGLSYSEFISSDKPFDNDLKEVRPDVLILNNPIAVADKTNDGTVFNSISIFEFKRPMRDDYSRTDNPIDQLLEYAKKIRDGNIKDCNHRPIRVTAFTQFYLYAICDITPSLKTIMDSYSYSSTPDGLGAYFHNSSLNCDIYIISYDKLLNDSKMRNRVLFDKLGIQY